jgi:hypothetical protein
MRAGKVVVVMLLLALLGGGITLLASAQESPKPKPDDLNASYKLEYVIAEIENGKKVNTRTYVLLTDEGTQSNMHMGMKVPVQGEKGPIYFDVGLRIDSRVRARENGSYFISTRFELSSLVDQQQTVNGAMPLRSVEYSTTGVIIPGKSIVIASGDDLSSQKKFELSVTLTKLR